MAARSQHRGARTTGEGLLASVIKPAVASSGRRLPPPQRHPITRLFAASAAGTAYAHANVPSLALEEPHMRRTVILIALLAGGCAGLRPSQREDIIRWQAETARLGHPEVKYEKYLDPGTATLLGFVPGGGFYVRPGLGVSSLVWPLSILWVPGKAHAASELYNYTEFRARVLAVRQEAQPKVAAPTRMRKIPADPRRATAQLERLEHLWAVGRISETEYLEQRQKIEQSLTDEGWEQQVDHPVR
jgi:hypothetical protein